MGIQIGDYSVHKWVYQLLRVKGATKNLANRKSRVTSLKTMLMNEMMVIVMMIIAVDTYIVFTRCHKLLKHFVFILHMKLRCFLCKATQFTSGRINLLY